MTDIKLSWDGETIKQEVNIPDRKFTPKEILDSLDSVRSQIDQMNEQKAQIENNLKMLEKDIKSAKDFEKERAEFEDKCITLQKDKLKFYIEQIKSECIEKAEKKGLDIYNQDKNAYLPEQLKNLKYVEFQRLLATNKKIAENISKRLITKYLFETPIFDNPF